MKRSTLVIGGLILGLILGYIFIPSIPLFGGKLPLRAIITRGASLNGLDKLLVPLAEKSFNILFLGGFIGAIGGFVISKVSDSKRTHS